MNWDYASPLQVKGNIKEIMVGVFNDMLANVSNDTEAIYKMQGAMALYNAIVDELDGKKEDK